MNTDQEQKPSKRKGWRLKTDSLYKLIIWFKDKNVRTFYSYDWKHRYSKTLDSGMGLSRFKSLITNYGSKAGMAHIYETKTGKLIARYFEGEPIAMEKSDITAKNESKKS